jgi:D-3-phosphoglycerate dehydrogenase / 2-oxoglutarate reductase
MRGPASTVGHPGASTAPGGVVAISTSSFGKESPAPLEALAAAGFEVRDNPHGRTLSTEEARIHLAGAVGLVAGTEKLTGELLRGLPELRAIARVGVGVDGVDLAAARERGIAVSNTPTAHVHAVAELALGGLMAVLRRLPAGDAAIRAGSWTKPMGRLLAGKTVGVVGFGRVGQAFARLCRGFGVTLLAFDPAADAAAAAALEVSVVSFDELLGAADVVSLHLPYARIAHHLLGPAQLACLKRDAVIVNTARGGLIDDGALAAHLAEHPLAGAYLDCFEREPYVGPLTTLPNVVLSAHIGSYAREARVQMEGEAVANLLRDLGAR